MASLLDTKNFHPISQHNPTAYTTGNLWSVLNQAGLHHMNRLSLFIDEIAPKPGSLVYLEAKKLAYQLHDMEPVIFSAVDLNTHIQIARLYLTLTVGSAVDFLDFVSQKFPFALSEVRTPAELPFSAISTLQAHHKFTSAAAMRGILHTIATHPSEDEILSAVSKLTFGGIFEGSIEQPSEQRLVRELINYLFFHNNHRSLPTLEGKTPIQKLKSFDGYDHLHLFDPYASIIRLKK